MHSMPSLAPASLPPSSRALSFGSSLFTFSIFARIFSRRLSLPLHPGPLLIPALFYLEAGDIWLRMIAPCGNYRTPLFSCTLNIRGFYGVTEIGHLTSLPCQLSFQYIDLFDKGYSDAFKIADLRSSA
ncbi:hypothetical protein K488DRAFT_72847 [Vararia minispora EC-137]|uniref:Uncharacterized protein n=1 Tax=Vararia minispora EC-137 TaxID=1314806 RepID=A0ACB8QCU6_9AGAM|nr:hypothetical protein K488DRAFT_72847 [Vararia minispora EC-137]